MSIIGFAVLAALFTIGAVWIIIAILGGVAGNIFKNGSAKTLAAIPSVLAVVGTIGFVIGLIVAIRVARADPNTQERLGERYIGRRGLGRIYAGAPLAVIFGVWAMALDPLTRAVGDYAGCYILLGISMVIFAFGIFLAERIPKKLVAPIGTTGWLLIVLAAFGSCMHMLHSLH